ncbi:MAG: hypothetical protein WC341_00445 [Bacteroidales bacterium]|jgi:hypothetical protein
MTKQEFEAWKKETERSKDQWIIDQIHNGKNGQNLLTFKGGENGHYLLIDNEGLMMVGTYEGATPHIGEASFKITAKHQCLDFNDAIKKLLTEAGFQFLVREFLQ